MSMPPNDTLFTESEYVILIVRLSIFHDRAIRCIARQRQSSFLRCSKVLMIAIISRKKASCHV